MSTAGDRRAGAVLVLLQFVLLAALAYGTAPAWADPAAPWLALALAAASLAVGLAAVMANRPGNFNVHPEPRAGGRLVEHGVYAWIRHPMYSALLLLALAAIAVSPGATTLCAGAALAAVLWAKSSIEERWMGEVHPGYAAYRARTKRFVPGLF
ncbi:methyltransferase family protein [Rubrivivax gelatinosus]|uniref:Protein-S-isoprenylcysteine O-methyltransferase Ste14 n=1 Tax=Rubrivivax gelatinosus TaxID=28068 RepID=A0A4R2M6L3_RUBGE|nr:methyltransferase [Rubrivivax gelatinosus]TCO99803.1 protein-S-isoprenylcysteine O-methyltransferase Ste14 [Rubrivivax gelatinosus]